MSSYCPHCGEWLVEQLIEQAVALTCPLCSKIYHVAEYVAESSAFPYEVGQEAGGLADLAKGSV
jgi:DNA-directed RNA polymerase subunit M/transcription elongation factor TFIIS